MNKMKPIEYIKTKYHEVHDDSVYTRLLKRRLDNDHEINLSKHRITRLTEENAKIDQMLDKLEGKDVE